MLKVMDADEVKRFEDYYRGHTVDQLTELFTKEDSGLRKETIEAIKNLILQKGGLDTALQNFYKNYSTQELFELLVKKEKILNESIIKAIKFNINNNEGSLEKFIEKESTKSGKILFPFIEIKNGGTDKINYFEGILYLTDKKVFFIPQKIKYSQNGTIRLMEIVITFSIFVGIGKIYYGILGAVLGAVLGTALFGVFDYIFNKTKRAEHYDLPLTLQAAYIEGSFQLNLSKITEVLIGKKKNYFIIISEKKIINRFDLKKEYMDQALSFFEKNNIKNRPQGNLVTEFKNYEK